MTHLWTINSTCDVMHAQHLLYSLDIRVSPFHDNNVQITAKVEALWLVFCLSTFFTAWELKESRGQEESNSLTLKPL